ncbi:ABC transporter permease [Lentzea sp. BCCO 10_0798]|uniref:ABC transporter permease n=1 Tax=Lentzea kristufekii TaxID=3095430 RepID=A0ABU4U674_9PSEU|nr:ABC transporter permease [Lentzea sp. BCCO 10_0798]MDX8056074.1 ABC transporter permease [Lentzea sp. BCCO 10_0798]
MTSAYPTRLEDLIPRVRSLAEESGEKPSIRGVAGTFNVGAKKARAALVALGYISENDRTETSQRRLQPVPALPDEPEPVAPPEHAIARHLPAQDQASDEAEPVEPQVTGAVDAPVTAPESGPTRTRSQVRRWPIVLIALGAFVAIWGGWVELGKLTGFGEITPLPGIADNWTINSAITLPLGMEAYAALALQVWLSGRTRSDKARSFAKWSALGALVLGAGGQVAYHLMKAAGMTVAPWQITTVVSCLPVIVLGFGAALVHLMTDTPEPEEVR